VHPDGASREVVVKDRIYITQDDMTRLRRLIAGRYAANPMDREYLSTLEEELDRAEVVNPDKVPRDVITMGSEVRLKDLDSKEVKIYRLVFPNDVRFTENALSILAPVGTALLGYRAGDVIEWQVPKGTRRLRVLKVLYQPEASGLDAA
jgi:regulator of nucleoside diphosphate kinase